MSSSSSPLFLSVSLEPGNGGGLLILAGNHESPRQRDVRQAVSAIHECGLREQNLGNSHTWSGMRFLPEQGWSSSGDPYQRKIERLGTLCQTLQKLHELGWKVEGNTMFGEANVQSGNIFLRKSSKVPSSPLDFAYLFDSSSTSPRPSTRCLGVVNSNFRELSARVNQALEERSRSLKINTADYGEWKTLEMLLGEESLEASMWSRLRLLEVMDGQRYRVEATLATADEETDVIIFSRRRDSSPPPSEYQTTFWALAPSQTGVKLFDPPSSVSELLAKEFLENPNWRKTDAIWQRRHHAGKRLVMYLIGRYRTHGWTLQCALGGAYKNAIFIFSGVGGSAEADKTSWPMMTVTMVSNKKLQPDFNVARYYAPNTGSLPKGTFHSVHVVSLALSAFAATGGIFDKQERVVRYADNTFEKSLASPQQRELCSNTSVILIDLLSNLYRHGWVLVASGNISGKDSAVLGSPRIAFHGSHTLFFVRQTVDGRKGQRRRRTTSAPGGPAAAAATTSSRGGPRVSSGLAPTSAAENPPGRAEANNAIVNEVTEDDDDDEDLDLPPSYDDVMLSSPGEPVRKR